MLNEDPNQRAIARVQSMDWQASPSGSVLRKRFHLTGEAENGQITSLVAIKLARAFLHTLIRMVRRYWYSMASLVMTRVTGRLAAICLTPKALNTHLSQWMGACCLLNYDSIQALNT